ncbi:hypothetical protein BZA77DRAFT_350922 [Pyronema omphalodes]|nr:hypothetical protein BZA77DRAFT_350922 [Pyronema omphalodes]
MHTPTSPEIFSSLNSSPTFFDSLSESPVEVDLPFHTPRTGSTCSDDEEYAIAASPSPEIIPSASSSRLLELQSDSTVSLLSGLSLQSDSSIHSCSVPSSLWCGGGSFVHLPRGNPSTANKAKSPAIYSPATLRSYNPHPLDASELTRRLELLVAERNQKMKEMIMRIIGGLNKDSDAAIVAMITEAQSGEGAWTDEMWKRRIDEKFKEKEGMILAVIDTAEEWMEGHRMRVNDKPTAKELTGRLWEAMFQ